MSENVRGTTNTLVIVLVVVVAVLAVGLGYVIWNNNNSVPEVTAVTPGAAAGAAAAGAGATGGMPGGAPAAAAAADPAVFDAKTATKVPAGTAPLAFIKAYHEDLKAGKFEEAYTKLPLDKQKSYGDAAAYAEQVKSYGITGYELGKPTESGDTFTIAATQVTPQMPITYTWTLKKVGDQWFVASRAMGGS